MAPAGVVAGAHWQPPKQEACFVNCNFKIDVCNSYHTCKWVYTLYRVYGKRAYTVRVTENNRVLYGPHTAGPQKAQALNRQHRCNA